LAVAATAASLLLGEILLRAFWHNSYRSDSAEFFVHLRIQPANRDYLVDRRLLDRERPTVRLRTNARSYILPASVYGDPDRTVVFLGGSTTECLAVAEELRFPALVSKELAKHGLRVNTLNAGRGGNSVHDTLNILVNHAVFDRPDTVVLMHAANDVGILSRPGGYRARCGRPLSIGDIGLRARQWASQYCYIIALVRKALSSSDASQQSLVNARLRNDPARAEQLPLEEYRRRLRGFVRLCKGLGIRPVLVTEPLAGTKNQLTPSWADLGAQDRCNAMIHQVGREEDALVIDLARYLQSEVPDWEEPMRVFYDGMHVTDAGSRIYAKYIASQLLPFLREQRVTDTAAAADAWLH
jgi:lysophospholipase L1-like esterase